MPKYPIPNPQPIVESPFMTEIQESYINQEDCDLEFQCKGGSIKAHRLILKKKSDFFKALFTKDLKENNTGVIALPAADLAIVKAILDYLYLQQNPLENPAVDPVELFELSNLWSIKAMITHAENAIGEQATPESYQHLGTFRRAASLETSS